MKTARLTFDIGEDGVSNIQVTADDPETRAKAMEKIQRALPSFELLERLLQDTDDSGERRD